jgi:hypothetical protein
MQCHNTTRTNGCPKAGLWHDHPATERQLTFAFPADPHQQSRRTTQADVLIELMRARRAAGLGLELPDILAIGIAQHSARLVELRARGFVIENEMQRSAHGHVVRSRYWLVFDPERDGAR